MRHGDETSLVYPVYQDEDFSAYDGALSFHSQVERVLLASRGCQSRVGMPFRYILLGASQKVRFGLQATIA